MTSSNATFNESILLTNNIIIFGDSLVNFNRKIKCNIYESSNNGSTRVNYFPGATSKDLLHDIDTTLQDNSFEFDTVNNKNYLNTDHMLQNIKNRKYKYKQKVLISGLLTTYLLVQDFMEDVNKLIKNICYIEGYCYVYTDDIVRANLFEDGLHLLDNGK